MLWVFTRLRNEDSFHASNMSLLGPAYRLRVPKILTP